MATIIERLEKLEVNDIAEGSAKDKLAKAQDDIARLQEQVLSVYKFVEENLGVHDLSLERRIKGPSH